MYRIMIVEDEPPITRYLKNCVESITKEFEIACTAENGVEALQKVAAIKPDVILTDVKMPVMNGIELVEKMKTDYSEIYTVIISGYQDFNYVKGALKWGAQEYLLKPVDPQQLKELLDPIAANLDIYYRSNASKILGQMISKLPADTEAIDKFLNYSQFYVMVIRKGSLPARFINKNIDFQELHYFRDLDMKSIESELDDAKIWSVNGRDEFESIVAIGVNDSRRFDVKFIVESFMERISLSKGFYTISYSSKNTCLNQIADITNRLFDILDQNIVIGRSQIFDIERISSVDLHNPIVLDDILKNKLVYFVSNKQMDHLKNELIKLFSEWEKQSYAQIWLEKALRQVLGIIEKQTAKLSKRSSLNIEKQLEEVMFYSTDYGSLLKSVWDIVEDSIGIFDTAGNSNTIISSVEVYIQKNISEYITLQNVCDIMGVSQTYISRLFRKHKNMSFNEYVTNVRIQEAKRLMTQHPDMLLKDISEIVGYNDSHYFSRIFKSVTGFTPSDYITQNQKQN